MFGKVLLLPGSGGPARLAYPSVAGSLESVAIRFLVGLFLLEIPPDDPLKRGKGMNFIVNFFSNLELL